MYRVKKRDGSTAAFNIKKVASAIRKAFDACDREYTDSVIDLFSIVNSVRMYVILQTQHLIIILLWTIISIQEINTTKGIQLTLLVV